MARGDGSLCRQDNSANYWMQFFLNGRKHRESTGESDEKKARNVLKRRLKEVHASEVTGAVFESARMRKITVSDLCDSLSWRISFAAVVILIFAMVSSPVHRFRRAT